jgi:rubrerythrin
MQDWESVDDVLDFAIKREQEAVDFYKDLADKVASPAMKAVFEQYSREELGHKLRLERIKTDKTLVPSKKQVLDLKMADYLVDVEATPNMSHQDALILAMKREKSAFKLYSDLSAATSDAKLSQIFASLAQEEAKHKLRFEVEYDEYVLTEN